MISTGIDPPAECAAATPVPEAPGEDGLLDERDFAGRQITGSRELQEDSYGVIPRAEFEGGPNDLFIVVADGMGGHAAGEVASSLAVNTFAETFLASCTRCDPGRLWDCLEESNRRISRELDARGDAVQGMGTTLLAVLLRGHSVRWISVGDSPLYLIRDGFLQRLNRLHSKATELAEKVRDGLISAEEARSDPSRHTLLSALIGEAIFDVDDPPAVALQPGDLLIAATDGIETLTHEEISAVASSYAKNEAAALADGLLQAVLSKNNPRQDNTTVVVVRLPEG
jgi:PPM family protein phosphatase